MQERQPARTLILSQPVTRGIGSHELAAKYLPVPGALRAHLVGKDHALWRNHLEVEHLALTKMHPARGVKAFVAGLT